MNFRWYVSALCMALVLGTGCSSSDNTTDVPQDGAVAESDGSKNGSGGANDSNNGSGNVAGNDGSKPHVAPGQLDPARTHAKLPSEPPPSVPVVSLSQRRKQKFKRVDPQKLVEYSKVISTTNAQGVAHVDPETGEVCWQALTCTSAKCKQKGKDGKPFLFALEFPGVGVTSDDKPDWRSISPGGGPDMRSCPSCGDPNRVHAYRDPATTKKLASLESKLQQVNAKLERAPGDDQTIRRTLAERDAILDEMAAQPVYFLCP